LQFQQTASWNEDIPMNHNPDDLLTPSDAARVLGLSADSVRVLSDNGRLPSMRTVSGRRLFRRSDVDRLAIQRAQSLTGGGHGGGATAAYQED
jgi:excisionase family DNA binding protein